MARVIALSGPQGGGKTTLLNGLRGHGYYVDDYKVSRAVQAELGWETLENVLTEPGTMMEFQSMILRKKVEREQQNAGRRDMGIILTERSFADIAAYTQLWCWELAHAGKWTVQDAIAFAIPFIDDCASFQRIYEGNILLPYMPHVAWQADPNRAKQKDVTFIVDELEQFFGYKNPKTVPVFRVTEGSVDGRIDQVLNWIKTL